MDKVGKKINLLKKIFFKLKNSDFFFKKLSHWKLSQNFVLTQICIKLLIIIES
jgi:hypothetical protein